MTFSMTANTRPVGGAFADTSATTTRLAPLAPGMCELPAGWDAVNELKPEFLIFGELHGTEQSPAFVGQVVCALAASGERILLAVEFDSSLDSQFQFAWGLPQDQYPEALSKIGWVGRSDGIASQAMFNLLVQLHAFKSAGAAISIVAFNGAKDSEQQARFSALPGQNPHEAAQAENIMLAAQADNYDLTIVLVGNIHAMKQPVQRPETTFEPMAMRLARSGVVVSLDMQSSGGTAWNCQLKAGYVPHAGKPITDDAISCANYDVRPDGGSERLLPMTIHLNTSEKLDNIYDGVFSVGNVTGSSPAVPKF
ncbi:hypothetical protein [Sphingomonas sp. LH128]|uniref:hypothetical protein n=1 Tax=Sphingomonas sp. LH128 TaxID=473781 RepID=UPI00155ED2F2|nr:hypothetical protein [Sphingomonas sp. LH128]